MSTYDQLLARLSPAIRAEVSFIVNPRWIDQVYYLRTSTLRELQTTTLRIELASRLSPFVFPRQFTPVGFMYIIERGGSWGEDAS